MNASRLALALPLMCAACTAPEPAATLDSAELESASAHHAVTVAQTNLVADLPGVAAHQDPQLVNAWGLAFNPKGPAWISDNGTGLSTVYDAAGDLLLTVTVPPPAGGTTSAPTGQVFNASSSDFHGDKFIFVTEDGTISGWQPGAGATLRVDNSTSSAVYKGVALVSTDDGARLVVTNFRSGAIEVYDADYQRVTCHEAFVDRFLPDGYAPFNAQTIGEHVFVTYAKQDAARHDDVGGAGHGFVDEYSPEGRLLRRVASHGALDSPWGLALAPASYGPLAGTLLVGNFGDGHINAYGLHHHRGHVGQLDDTTGAPLVIDGLWAIMFGPGTTGEATDQLFFTAGLGGEAHGLYGRLDVTH